MEELVQLLKDKQLTISSIESFTGGLFASQITSIPGASRVFTGTLVAYDTKVKKDKLKIDEVIEKYGVISKECAIAMAEEGSKYFNSDITLSLTGNAGPDAMDGKKAGLTYMALNFKDKTLCFEDNLHFERNILRQAAVNLAVMRIKQEFLG